MFPSWRHKGVATGVSAPDRRRRGSLKPCRKRRGKLLRSKLRGRTGRNTPLSPNRRKLRLSKPHPSKRLGRATRRNFPKAASAQPQAPQAPAWQNGPRAPQPQARPAQAQPQARPAPPQPQGYQQPQAYPPEPAAAPLQGEDASFPGEPEPAPKQPKPKKPALLKWGIVALVASVILIGLWLVLGKSSSTTSSSGAFNASEPVLDPDDPRSRKADKLPSKFPEN